MQKEKNHRVLIKFLIDNKRYWSYSDFKRIINNQNTINNKIIKPFNLTQHTITQLKYNLLNGKISDRILTKYKEQILNLCKIVTKRLDDEKEILESIKKYQTVN